jgi:hypothetical protein
MTTLTWIGGGNNHASNYLDWSPNQVPQPNDILEVGASGNSGIFTMNVSGNDLAGDDLEIFAGAEFTANLSQKAEMTASDLFSGPTIFNLSQQSTLSLSISRVESNTINLSQNSTLKLGIDRTSSTVDIFGKDAATISGDGQASAIINLAGGARWSGTFNGAGVTVNGGAGSTFNNDGESSAGGAAGAIINADVVGKGSFSTTSDLGLPTSLEFVQSVGSNQSIQDSGFLQIDQPNEFKASVTLTPAPSGSFPPPEIDLVGLANASSYSYKNDMLSIFSGKSIIDTLRLSDQTKFGFDVVQASGSVNIVTLTSSGQLLSGALPMHV